MTRLISACVLVVAAASPAAAQTVKLQINGGRVTLDAVNAPARQILTEWARIGGTAVVGADKVGGAPLTLRLVDMPERQALDIILRNVAGFMAAQRRPGTAGASGYDRILIMAVSTNAAQAQSAGGRPAVGAPANGLQRRIPPRPPNLPPSPGVETDDTPEMPVDDPADTGAAPPVFTFPGQQGNQPFVPIQSNPQNGPFGTPVITLQPGPNGPTIYNLVPQPAGPNAPPAGFGVIGSPTPGVIQVPAQPAGTRPPGGER